MLAVPHTARQARVDTHPPGHLQAEAENRGQRRVNRHGTVPDEPRLVLHRHPHQPRAEAPRRRPGYRGVRDCEPHRLPLHHGRAGAQPGDAADSWLQLRRTAIWPRGGGAEEYDIPRHVRDDGRFPHQRADSRTGGQHLHDRPRVDGHRGAGVADSADVLPHRGIPDGHVQLLPVHRDGKEGHLPVGHEAVPLPHPVPHHPAGVLGAGRGVVQYANLRCRREHPGIRHAEPRDKEVQAGRRQGDHMKISGVGNVSQPRCVCFSRHNQLASPVNTRPR